MRSGRFPVEGLLIAALWLVSGAATSHGHQRWVGAPISVRLQDAELHEVLHELVPSHVTVWLDGRLAEVRASVDVRAEPWDRAVDEVLRTRGLVAQLNRDTNAMAVRFVRSGEEPGLIVVGTARRPLWV